MYSFRFDLQGPGKYSELDPQNPEANEAIVEDLLSQALRQRAFIAIISQVNIHFNPCRNIYLISIQIQCLDRIKVPHDEEYIPDWSDIELTVESLISQAMF